VGAVAPIIFVFFSPDTIAILCGLAFGPQLSQSFANTFFAV